MVWDLGTGRNQDSGELFFPVSRQVQINLIFHDMNVYYVDAAMSCMQKIYSYSQKG